MKLSFFSTPSLLRLSPVVVAIYLAHAAAPARAEVQPGGTVQSAEPTQPLLIQADVMWFDENTNQAHAKGNVQIYQPSARKSTSPNIYPKEIEETQKSEVPGGKADGSFYGLATSSTGGGNVLLAHEVTYNTVADELTATGGPSDHPGGASLTTCSSINGAADDQDETSGMSATTLRRLLGKILIYDDRGTLLAADSFRGSPTLGDATLVHPSLRTSDNRRIASVMGYKDGPISRLERTVYTPCDSCPGTNPIPLWQIKAEEVIHDDVEHDIIFKDAWLEMWGYPVLYLPRLSQPDPTVERRSGFLGMQFSSSKSLGFSLTPTYYHVLSPQTDFIFAPILTTKEKPVLGGTFRHRFNRGVLNFEGSLTQSKIGSSSGTPPKPHANTRWYVDATAAADLSDVWRVRTRIYRQSDANFLMRYKFSRSNQLLPDTLTSDIIAEGFYGQNYAAIKGYAFQSTNPDINQRQLPIIAPHASYTFTSSPNEEWGSNFYGKMGLMNLVTQKGYGVQRFNTLAGWQIPLVSPGGDLITLRTQAHADGYITEHLNRSSTVEVANARRHTYATTRLFPQIGLEWRRPMINDGLEVPVVVSPIVSIVGAPVIKTTYKIPNEDSRGGIELDESSLFLMDRFAGVDRLDSGSRVSYGVLTELYPRAWQSAKFFLGQSYAFNHNAAIPARSGAGKGASDIVGMMEIAPSSIFSLRYRFLLDSKARRARTGQVTATFGYPIFSVTGSYLYTSKNSINTAFAGKEQVTGGLKSQFTEFWRAEYGITRNLGKDGGNLEQGLGFIYEDECFKFGTRVNKSYFHNQELQPETSVYFTFGFKTLGEYSTGTSITKVLDAQNKTDATKPLPEPDHP